MQRRESFIFLCSHECGEGGHHRENDKGSREKISPRIWRILCSTGSSEVSEAAEQAVDDGGGDTPQRHAATEARQYEAMFQYCI